MRILLPSAVFLLLPNHYATAAKTTVVGEGGRLNTFDKPKLKLFSGKETEHILTWQEAKDFCSEQEHHTWLAHTADICENKKKPADNNMYTGLKADDQWLPIRDGGQKNHWLQIGHLNNGTSTKGTCESYRKNFNIARPNEQMAELAAPDEVVETPDYCIKPDGCTGNQCVFDCKHPAGFYPDPTDCRAYCKCSGGDGPSFWEIVTTEGFAWDPYCAMSFPLLLFDAPLGGMTGGCPAADHYVHDKGYCTPGASRKLRAPKQKQTSLRGGNRELAVEEYQFNYDNRPEWGYLPDKYYGETNSLVCSHIPKLPNLPATCGSLWGDPHFWTFDGLKYDLQGTGEFTLSKSLTTDFEIQVDMRRFDDEKLQATVARKVVVSTGRVGEPKVEMSFMAKKEGKTVTHINHCTMDYYLDDQQVDLDSKWGMHGTLATGTEAAAFYRHRHDVYFYFPGSQVSLHVEKKHSEKMGCYLNVKVCLPDEITQNENIVGLFGSPNGQTSDDFMDKDGNDLDHQDNVDWKYGYEYGTKNWCNRDIAESLFESPTTDPDDCDAPYDDGLERAIMGAPEELREVCGFHVECITEGVAGGIADSTDSVRVLKKAYDIDIAPEVKDTDPDPAEEDEVFENTSVKPAEDDASAKNPFEEETCPSNQPIPGSPCSFTTECYYGKDRCCGVTHPSFTANCYQGQVVAFFNDACLDPKCDETDPPSTDGPTDPPSNDDQAGTYGDPHFKTWKGDKFDFNGGCDLILLQNPHFANGHGLDIHIRTKINTWWSFIEAAVIRVGHHTLEVMGGKEGSTWWLDGQQNGGELEDGKEVALGGYPLKMKKIKEYQIRFRLDLGSGDAISVETYKTFVRINVKRGKAIDSKFARSIGMLGAYPDGRKVARDLKTVVADADDFGQQWQVLDSEPMLFHKADGPQHPTKCAMPTETETSEKRRRRLGQSLINLEDATVACAHVREDDQDACIFDVLATNDKDMAGSY